MEESLKGFSGSILFVSHDRYFINQLATGLLILNDDGSTEFFDGTYSEYTEKQKEKNLSKKAAAPKQTAVKEEKKRLSPEGRRRQLAAVEKKITECEAELEQLRALRFDPEYYQDYQKMNDLEERIDNLEAKSAALMDEWEELSEEE